MINLKIDPEFQNQIPPLTDDEYKQLEENILKEGNRFTTAMLTRKKCGMIMSHWNTLQHVSAQSLTIF